MTARNRFIGVLICFLLATFASVFVSAPIVDARPSYARLLQPRHARARTTLAGGDGRAGQPFSTPAWQQANANGFGDPLTDEVSAVAAFNGYLYAGTSNVTNRAGIYRAPDGVIWTPVIQPGFGIPHDTAPPAILDLEVFNNRLYATTGRGDGPGQIWRTLDGVNWAPMVIAGFADPDNVDIGALVVYNGAIYAGARNLVTGAQIWRSFNGDSNTWTQVAPAVAGTDEAGVTGFAEFDGALYAAVESAAPAQIWRSYGGDWTTIVSDGFGHSDTTLTGGMAAFAGNLYVGAGNTSAGAQLWRTADGASWSPAITPGLGDANNLKVEAVIVFQNQLYVSVQNATSGVELWRSPDGTMWEQANLDGFGDSHNTTSNRSSATAAFADMLYVGTANALDGGELWRMRPPYGVTLSPDAALAGLAGQTVTYSLEITNTGSLTDSFDLVTSGQTWTTTLSAPLVHLTPLAAATFTVTVAIPPGAADQDTDNVTVTATSQADNSMTDAAVLSTTALAPVYGAALSDDAALTGAPGQTVTFTLTLTNTGNRSDTFDLSAAGQTWTTTLSAGAVTLAPSAAGVFSATVTIPPGAADQEADSVTVMATSQADSSKTGAAVLTTTAVAAPVYGVLLSPDASLSGPAGQVVTYTLTLTNTGNVVDTYDLVPGGHTWTTTLAAPAVTLPAGSSRAVAVTVLIPATAAALDSDQVAVQATSRHDGNQHDAALLTTVSLGPSVRLYLPVLLLPAGK